MNCQFASARLAVGVSADGWQSASEWAFQEALEDQTGTAEVMGALSDKPLPEVKCRQCLRA